MAVVYYGLAVERDTIDRRPLFIESDTKPDAVRWRSHVGGNDENVR